MPRYQLVGIVIKQNSVSVLSTPDVFVKPSHVMMQHAAEGWEVVGCSDNVMWFQRAVDEKLSAETEEFLSHEVSGTCNHCGGQLVISKIPSRTDRAYRDNGRITHVDVSCGTCGTDAPPFCIVPLVTKEEFTRRNEARSKILMHPGTGILCSVCNEGELVSRSSNFALGGAMTVICRHCGAEDILKLWGDK